MSARSIDPTTLDGVGLKALIANHKRHKVFDEIYRSAIAESARRGSVHLDISTSLNVIRAAAAEGRFISYLEVCHANGATWDKARFQMFTHLGDLLDYAHAHGIPLVTAVVVAKNHLQDGKMDEQTRAGFVTAARDLGFPITDEIAFLEEQQQATFAWAKRAANSKDVPGDNTE